MASNQGRGTGKNGSGTSKRTANSKNSSRSVSAGRQRQSEPMDLAIRNEILLIVFLALAVILFLCNFGIVGSIGNAVSGFMFGLFGIMAYVAPVIIFLAIAFGMSNIGNNIAVRKLVAGLILFVLLGMVFELISGGTDAESYQIAEIYSRCRDNRGGGGILAGSIAYASHRLLGMVGTVLAMLVAAIICLVVVTEKSFINGVTNRGRRVYEYSLEDAEYRRRRARERREAIEEKRARSAQQRRRLEEEKENEKILRMDKKVTGVMIDTALSKEKEKDMSSQIRDDIHEITLNHDEEEQEITIHRASDRNDEIAPVAFADSERVTQYRSSSVHKEIVPERQLSEEHAVKQNIKRDTTAGESITRESIARESKTKESIARESSAGENTVKENTAKETVFSYDKKPKKYIFPPINKLMKNKNGGRGDSSRELRETAMRLQQTLQTFGVKVTVTDISQGPSVTRYELQPEQGVKVSRIVGLADDIKLNLAATDIRIEAPIPGKAAVGIEVPNKENSAVALRDLIESNEFQQFESRLAFAVGMDIGGQVIVTDIAKMPHMLIAGATGSGKSVCINTIIMSILYKAHPDDVKLIMVDPKVVELSVYNGIPHLLIPVVTDPKKAAAALHWGVAEMEDRYRKFADFNVRDLKGYNKAIEKMQAEGMPDAPSKMPQILIIVDELADLMMVAPGEVEESICRLAQLARAAGIHLIIATQRPSVDVITGLIKANMPSRIAFAVSSGVDSRTILDMVGAEKLLGKGDMLFYPQGYPKPVRVQGAFVSDKEVSDVVDFLKNQAIGNVYSDDIEEKIKNIGGSQGSGGASGSDSSFEYDEHFAEAGRFIIEKDKASIGMLQRVFKIGFNRAARIMDQLCEAGVVGEEEGTKPRKVLMSEEAFETLLEEIL